MRFIRHVAFRATTEQLRDIRALGIQPRDCPKTSMPNDTRPPLIEFDIDEADPAWLLLSTWLRQWDIFSGMVRTEFTPREIESARWLNLHAWTNGFPQPQDLEGYAQITFDLAHWCDTCSSGKVQNAPFRIKCEPKWNRRSIMTLHWVHDAFFVPPAIWETVFKPFGIGCRPVANRRGIELKTVVQLVVDEEVDIVTEGLKPLPCEACGLVRYEWPTRGPFPALLREPASAIAKSRQRLGHGWSNHAVFISQDLFQAFKAHNLRGAEVTPVDAALPAVVA